MATVPINKANTLFITLFVSAFLDCDLHWIIIPFYPFKMRRGNKRQSKGKNMKIKKVCITIFPYFIDFVRLLFSFVLLVHFPIQKLENIFPSKSSEVTIPVISARLICACLKSSATNSPAWLTCNWFNALAT